MGALEGLTALLGAALIVVEALIALVAALFGLLAFAARSLVLIIVVIVILLVAVPVIQLQSKGVETVVETMVTVVYPAYVNDIRPIAAVIVEVLNPVLCWTNAATSFTTNAIRQVIYPTIKECGVRKLAGDFGTLLKYVGLDLIVFFANGSFLRSYADFSRVSPAAQTVAQDWIDLYMCSCSDLGNIVRVLPILSPTLVVPPMIPLIIFSQEWTYPETWCAIANAFNAGVAFIQQSIQLAIQVLTFLFGNPPPGSSFIRPDLTSVVTLACAALHCAARSTEKAYQLLWDTYVPFSFVWNDFLCVFDTLGCIALKSINWLFTVLVNIDKAVSYPGDPFWVDVAKPKFIEIVNSWAAPTNFAPIPVPAGPAPTRFFMTTYYLNTSDPLTPDGTHPNPLYGAMRMTDCLCIFVDRLICDPADNQTACFSTGAQNLLVGIDFCCVANTVGPTLADVAAAAFEATLHFARGADDFFLSLDAQPFTTQLAADLTLIAHCLLSIFDLIPVVGTCIQNLLTDLVRLVLQQVDFAIRGIIGLASLPYFLIVLPDIQNFILYPNRALDAFILPFEALVADTPTSLKNCMCVILNHGFPIPPIPCSSCEVGGFIPPPPPGQGKRGAGAGGGDGDHIYSLLDAGGPVGLFRRAWPHADVSNHITPLIRYDNHTSDVLQLFNLLWINVQSLDPQVLQLPNLRAVDSFVDAKKEELMQRWGQTKQCNARADELQRMARTEPRLYRYRKERGDFEGQCESVPANDSPFPPFPSAIPTRPVYHNESESESGRPDRQAPIIISPTEPPVVGCNNPVPECFDICCIFRATLTLLVQILATVARSINGLVQHDHTELGTKQDYPYFTGEYANYGLPTFESDIIAIILDAFVPLKCVCEVFNLVIPVTPSAFTAGRPDICCAITYLGNLVAGTIQVLFNVINALAMGASTNYSYFVQGYFIRDINTLLDIALLVVNCICIFVRAVFPADYIPGFANATDFDICCGVQVLLDTAIELTRLILQVIISIATITVNKDSFCYWRLDRTADHNCAGTLDGIGVIVQIDKLLDTFFPVHTTSFPGEFVPLPDGSKTWISNTNPTSSGGACYTTCGIDDGASGIVPCICQIFNTLIPFRRFPNLKVNCSPDPALTNCQELDLCCGFAKIGFAASDLTKFMTRATAAIWQSWTGGLPEFFTHYIWCAEPLLVPCPQLQANSQTNPCESQVNVQIPQCSGTYPVLDSMSVVQYRCGEFTCGKFNIVIADLTDPFQGLLSKCVCEIVALLDTLIAFIFDLVRGQPGMEFATWSCCFCGGSDPITGTCNANTVNPCGPTGNNIFTPYGDPQNPSGSGILPAMSYIANALLVALVRLSREFPLACYWHPAPKGVIPQEISQTWIFEFLGPTADAASIAVGNSICILQSMFFLPLPAMPYGQKFIGSTVRWGFEVAFRIIGFIEAFVEALITPQYACTGPNCASTGPDIVEAHSVSADQLGSMLTILFSIPFDLLIGDSAVACTTVCPPFDAMPGPDENVPPLDGCIHSPINESCSCGCWNHSPMFGGSSQSSASSPYLWVIDSNPLGQCKDTSPDAVKNNITRHIGTLFGRTDGCCKLQYAPPSPSWLSAFPACQSPADVSYLYDTHIDSKNVVTYTPPGYPGSCIYFSACRDDNLPSIANDPMTPHGLSINYSGAIDGIVLGFFRYMRALLDHLFTCQTAQAYCDPNKQHGIIFYPAILIFSIVWQLLGGLINFLSACTVFFFTLFQPPTGSTCGCWNADVIDHFGASRTQYYRPTAALCYACRVIGMDCNTPVNYGSYINDPRFALSYRCRPYCPVMQRLANPSFTDAQAYHACTTDWILYGPKDFNLWSAEEVCTGHIGSNATMGTNYAKPLVYYQYYPAYPYQQCSIDVPEQCNAGGDPFNCKSSVNHGLCNPIDFNTGTPNGYNNQPNGPGQLCGNDVSHYIPLDLCPDPSCIYLNATGCFGGICGVVGMWPCGQGGGSVFDTVYPSSPLVTCGVIQIVTNFLAVFASFTAMFTTPIFITPNHRRADFVGPVSREPRQAFNNRMRNAWIPNLTHEENTRAFFGQTTGAPNLAWVVTSAVYDYDTSDCYHDPVACHCRNLDLSPYCSVTSSGEMVYGPLGRRKRDPANDTDDTWLNMTSADLTQMLSEQVYTGTSVCDRVVAGVAGLDWDDNVTQEQKHHVVSCSDQLFMGSRLNTIHSSIPSDIMYNTQAPLKLMSNLFGTAKRVVNERQVEQEKRMERERHESRPHGTEDGDDGDGGGEGGKGPSYEDSDVRTDFERRFPNWRDQLRQRQKFARNVLTTKYGMKPSRMMYSAIVHADSLWFKYHSGYYSWMGSRFAKELTNSTRRWLPSTQAALAHVSAKAWDLGRIVWNQQYRQLVDATVQSAHLTVRMLGNVYAEGTANFVSRNVQDYREYRVKRIAQSDAPKRKSRLVEAFKASPLFRWWFEEEQRDDQGEQLPLLRPSVLAPFVEHMKRVVSDQRKRWHTSKSFSLWTMDLHFWSIKDILFRRWQNPVWKPGQRENWNRLQTFYWRLRHRIWPGEPLPEEAKQRFLFNSNCPVVDRLVNLTINTVEYCAAQTLINMRHENPSLGNPDSYFGYRHMPHRYRMEPSAPSNPGSWLRPRLVPQNETNNNNKIMRGSRTTTPPHPPMERHGPGGWTLIDWLSWVISTVFNINFSGTRDDWFAAVMDWLKNPNTSDSDRPNVGLLYWLRFEFICNFPTSYNCSYGLGFEWGLWWTLAGSLVVIFIGSSLLSLATVPFQILGYGISFAMVWLALSFGFPLICAVPVPFLSTGFGVPECLPDQLLAFADKYITNCYVPLIIPSYMVAGPICPANGKIDFLDCRDIGVSDGITNILFLGVWLFGSGFTNIVLQITGTALGLIIPGMREYMQLTLDAMLNANPTHMQRETFCFFATIYMLIPSIAVLIALGLLAFFLIPPLLMIFEALTVLFLASPASVIVPGRDASTWFPNLNAANAKLSRGAMQRQQGTTQSNSGPGASDEAPTTPASLVQRYLYGFDEMKRKKNK